MSAQSYYCCKFKAKTISLSHFPQNISAKNFPPFSFASLHFPFLFSSDQLMVMVVVWAADGFCVGVVVASGVGMEEA